MNTHMIIVRGSSINADTVEILIIRYDKVFFTQKFAYGYNASYDKSWATEQKPFIDDIIQSLKEEYSVTSVKEIDGRNIFQEGLQNERP